MGADRERHRDRRRGHQDEDAGRVGATLCLDVGVEDDRDDESDEGEEHDERTGGPRPLGRHAVARQVTRHEVEEPGHRRRAGKPENGDRAQVVGRAERLAEVLVGEKRQRPAPRLPAFFELVRRNEQRGHERAADEQHRHDERRRAEQLAGVADPALRRLGIVAGIALDERHHRDAGLESRQAERQLRKDEERGGQHHHGVAVRLHESVAPSRQVLGVVRDLEDAPAQHDHVQPEINCHDEDREANGLAEALQEDRRQHRQQEQREQNRMIHPCRHERIGDDVRGGVGCRERDGDDEVGRRKPEQHENEDFAAPPRQQFLEHRDAALAMRAVLRHATVNRQRAKEGEEDEDNGRDRRERARGQERDAGLVAERREIIDAGQAHDLPPGGLVDVAGMRPGRLAEPLEKPPIEPAALSGSWSE